MRLKSNLNQIRFLFGDYHSLGQLIKRTTMPTQIQTKVDFYA